VATAAAFDGSGIACTALTTEGFRIASLLFSSLTVRICTCLCSSWRCHFLIILALDYLRTGMEQFYYFVLALLMA